MSAETDTVEEIKTNINKENDPLIDELEKEFEEFQKTTSTHKVENDNKQSSTQTSEKDIFEESESLSVAEDFKLQIFANLFFGLIDGVHVFIYSLFTKYKLKKDDIALDDDDKEQLLQYFKTKRIMAMLNKLPTELVGLIHMEYMYFQRFEEWNEKMKRFEKRALKEIKDAEEEEEEEEEEETKKDNKPKTVIKKPAKKAVRKKAAKKKAVKKAPVKKEIPVKKSE